MTRALLAALALLGIVLVGCGDPKPDTRVAPPEATPSEGTQENP
jgi:hypothetical protein